MSARPPQDDPDDTAARRPGLYDQSAADADLWFLPAEDDDPQPFRPAPPPQRSLIDAAEWRAAEGALSGDLAALAHDAGRLAERIATMGPGAAERLALREAAAVSWWLGDRIGPDRLALWLAQRAGATSDDAPGVARAGWLARRLAAPAPASGSFGSRIAALLARAPEDRLAEAEEAMAPAESLQPLSQGCLLFHIWRMLGDSQARDVEAVLLGARLGVGPGLPFLPLSLTGYSALTTTGSAERRLSGWCAGAHQAVLSALMQLDQLRRWSDRAQAATADLSGRTPALLIGCLTRWPLVTAPLAEAETRASRAAVQRNMDRLADRDLIREVTGQGRFRVWTARV